MMVLHQIKLGLWSEYSYLNLHDKIENSRDIELWASVRVFTEGLPSWKFSQSWWCSSNVPRSELVFGTAVGKLCLVFFSASSNKN